MAARTPTPSAEVPPFTGIPLEAIDFYRQLEAHNTREWWLANKATYDEAVKAPFVALAAELADEFGMFHLFRPNRDVRFSKDKSPYKSHQGAVTEGEGGEAYYFAIGPEGLFVGSGYYRMAKDQLERFRQAIVDDATGPDFERLVAAVERTYSISGEELKTAPRGYDRDHPRVRFLRHKGVTLGREYGAPAWLATKRAKSMIVKTWRGADPVHEWLNANVGPSHEPPDERR